MDLTPQPPQLLLLVARELFLALACVQIRQFEPQAQRFTLHVLLVGNLALRFPTGPGQPNGFRPKLWQTRFPFTPFAWVNVT